MTDKTDVRDAEILEIFQEITGEIGRATAKFPTWPSDPLHALAVLGEEYGELNKAVLQMTYEPQKTSLKEVQSEALQTAAMAVRFMLNLQNYDYRQSNQLGNDINDD